MTLLSLLTGFLLTWWATSFARPGTWDGLGYALIGTVATLVGYLVVAVVSPVLAFRWALPPGRRWAPVLGYRFGFGVPNLACAVAAMVAVPAERGRAAALVLGGRGRLPHGRRPAGGTDGRLKLPADGVS